MPIYRQSQTPIAGTSPTGQAANVTIEDSAGYYDGTTVEAVFAELGSGSVRFAINVYNDSGSDMTVGQAVYISGYNTANAVPTVGLADADTAAKMPAYGLVDIDGISNGAVGKVVVFGRETGIDTSSYTVGDALYISTTAGDLTTTRPTGATDGIQVIGRVTEVATDGTVFIAGAYRANALPQLSTNKYWEGDANNQPAEITADDIKANMSLTTGKILFGASNLFSEKDPEQVVTQTLIIPIKMNAAVAATDEVRFVVPDSLNGCDLVNVNAAVATNTFSSGTFEISVYNVTDTAEMLSTNMTIDTSELSTVTAATPAVINTATDDIATDDIININVVTIGGGGSATNLTVTLEFLKP